MLKQLSIRLHPDEKRPFRLLFLQSLLVGSGLAFYFVLVNSFLIQQTSIYSLPQAYIISGIVGFLLVRWYRKLQKKRGIIAAYYSVLAAFLLLCAINYLLFVYVAGVPAYATWLAYWAYLFNMPFTIIFSLCFFSICAQVFNLSQSKKLLALVSTGEIIASIIAYLLSPVIIRFTGGMHPLLIVAALSIAAVFLPLGAMKKHYGGRWKIQPTKASSVSKFNFSVIASNRFYLLIAVGSVFSVLAVYFVDYTYILSVKLLADASGIQVASIVAVFFSFVKAGELLFSLFSGRIISSKGIRFSLLVLPVLISLSFLFAAIGGLGGAVSGFFVIAFIFLAKWNERVIRKAISLPATKVLYQAAEPSERLEVESAIDGGLNQLVTVGSGVLLLAVSYLLGWGKQPFAFLTAISFLCFLLFAGWVILNLFLNESYRNRIQQILHHFKDAEKKFSGMEAMQFAVTDDDTDWKAVHKTVNHFQQLLESDHENTLMMQLYNPSTSFAVPQAGGSFAKLEASYFNSDHFFNRIGIVHYLFSSNTKMSFAVFENLWDVSDVYLKAELSAAFAINGEPVSDASQFAAESIAFDLLGEMVWTKSALHDLEQADGVGELVLQLNAHYTRLRIALFNIWKKLYDANAIRTVLHVIERGSENVEDKLFAFELLENILKGDMKKRALLVFDAANFQFDITKLQQHFTVISLSAPERLEDIFLKSFVWNHPALKEAALSAYLQLTSDTRIMNAFAESSHFNLKLAVMKYREPEDYNNLIAFVNRIQQHFGFSSAQMAYVLNYGIKVQKGKPKRSERATIPSYVRINIPGFVVDVDCCALAAMAAKNALHQHL